MDDRYTLSARVIHWLMAIGFLVMWCSGYSIAEIVKERSEFRNFLFSTHFTVGVTLIALLALRIVIRVRNTPPPLPPGISEIERVGARLGHLALYVLPAIIIAIGWGNVNMGGFEVLWLWFEMPKIFPTLEGSYVDFVEELTEDLHAWLAYTMLGVAVGHVAAALKHRWIDGHDVLYRMTFGKRTRG